MMNGDLQLAAASLARAAGLGPVLGMQPIPGAGNNRVFRLDAEEGAALLKVYFSHPADSRDRLSTEFSFLTVAWECGVWCVPRPLGFDPENRLGLYEFVPGRRVSVGEIGTEELDEALAFLRNINRHRQSAASRRLPAGSEACFSVADHLRVVDRRVKLLLEAPATSTIEREAGEFVRRELVPLWQAVAIRVERAAQGFVELRDAEYVLSPSDFGFHNALRTENGALCFIDFEYAGWDDVAKLICDFFCQPRVPVPLEFYERFATAAVADLPRPDLHRARADLLLPLYRVKWCCILLNEFLPVGDERRQFAGAGDRFARQAEQLQKARTCLRALRESLAA